MIARKMLPQEIDSTITLCEYYRDEAAQTLPEIDQDWDHNSVIETIKNYCSHYEYTWINLYEGTRPVGLIAGCITAQPWNLQKLNGHIDLIYVLESHRSLDSFRTLITEFTEWAKLCGCEKLTAGDIGIDPERTEALYKSHGFTKGVWMSKEI